jgi:hypothetical protein
MDLDPSSAATLRRLAFRVLVILTFVLLWPGPSVAVATAALCAVLGLICFTAAHAFGEPFGLTPLNHWHEGAILLALACVAILAL